jgi:pimeloyl-ACP methyl ester carboxylesterase
MDGSMFHGLAQRCSQWRCISWDARGHGRSEGPPHAFSYDDLADDLDALLAHLDIRKAVVVGVSQGGQVALRCALRHSARVRALVLMGTQASTEDPQKLPGHTSLVQEWAAGGLSDPMARAWPTGWSMPAGMASPNGRPSGRAGNLPSCCAALPPLPGAMT